MTRDFDRVVAVLGARLPKGSAIHRAHCPAHPDRQQSLLITQESDGSAIHTCTKGCTPNAVGEAVRARLASLDDDRAPESTGRLTAAGPMVPEVAGIDGHPYQVMSDLAPEEWGALLEDIRTHGVNVAIVMDEHGRVIDGHHRLRAVRELGITHYPTDIRHGLTEAEKLAMAWRLNHHRRHLSKEERDTAIVRIAASGQSVRGIAEALAVAKSTVARTLAGVPRGTPDHPGRTTGVDGKSYPTARSATGSPAPVPFGTPQNLTMTGTGTMPHVARNSGNHEWYTPPEILECVRECLGVIDLDPASSTVAQTVVKATQYFTIDDDGLAQPWSGRVFLNPPYARDAIGAFITKLTGHIDAGDVSQAVVLTNNGTDTGWCDDLWERASAVAFPPARVRFLRPDGTPGAPLQGQMLTYCGTRPEAFAEAFPGWRVWVPSFSTGVSR